MFFSIILLFIFIILVYKFATLNHNYWKERGVPYLKPQPFVGNIFRIVWKRETFQDIIQKWYTEFEGHRYFGIFLLAKPCLFIKDIKLINAVLKTDFSRFTSRGLVIDPKRDPLTVNLFFMDGKLWKRTRELLRPGFKSGRLRMLVPMVEKSVKLVFGKGEVNFGADVKSLAKRFAAAVIAGPVLGLELNDETVDNFLYHCNQSFNVQGWRAVPVLMRLLLPRIALPLGMKAVLQTTEDFFKNIVERAKLGRENENNVKREDYLETIISSINRLTADNVDQDFRDSIMSGQFFLFVLAGFETTAATLTNTLYHLAHDQNVCETARQEILTILDGERDNLTYDHLKKMKYLENVINEVLRLHPPVPAFLRVCTSSYKIPDSDIVLQPGDTVHIPVWSLQNDPQYFDEPEKFLPSRFDKPTIEGTFLPFAIGPRNCLGMRLALMELKIALAYIIIHYNINIHPKTPKTIEVDPEHLIVMPSSEVWLRMTPLLC